MINPVKKQVKDLTNDEVDSEIQRLAKQYNITVDKDGGATATMDKLAENESRGKAEEALEASRKKAAAETDKSKAKQTAAPKAKKKAKAKTAAAQPKPKAADTDKPKEASKPVEESKSRESSKFGSLGIPNYSKLTLEERKEALRKSDEAWAEKRKQHAQDKKLSIKNKAKPEAWRNTAGEELAKLRKKS